MLFDTHAHYDDSRFDGDRDELLRSLPGEGVGLVLNPGCDLASSRKAVACADTYPHVYAAAGIHPENIEGVPDEQVEEELREIEALAAHPKVRAVGEIGLDYYWEKDEASQRQGARRAQAPAGAVPCADAHGGAVGAAGDRTRP